MQIRRLGITLACAVMIGSTSAQGYEGTNDLESGFINPPNSARPGVYWFWVDGNVSREGITADLNAMKGVGIGAVLLMDVSQQIPSGPVRFGSPQWRDMPFQAVPSSQGQ